MAKRIEGLGWFLMRRAWRTDYGRCSCENGLCGFYPARTFREWLSQEVG